MAVLEHARPITRIDSEISDEQDLLNDVVAGSCLDRDVHFHATRVLIFNTVRDSPDWPTQGAVPVQMPGVLNWGLETHGEGKPIRWFHIPLRIKEYNLAIVLSVHL